MHHGVQDPFRASLKFSASVNPDYENKRMKSDLISFSPEDNDLRQS